MQLLFTFPHLAKPHKRGHKIRLPVFSFSSVRKGSLFTEGFRAELFTRPRVCRSPGDLAIMPILMEQDQGWA